MSYLLYSIENEILNNQSDCITKNGKLTAKNLQLLNLAGIEVTIGLIRLRIVLYNWLVELGEIAVGGAIYLTGVSILKAPEIKTIVNAIMRRLLRRPTISSS
ncbi:MAG TPA: hypothetical protein DCX53_04005 [Anaerolineae bacterium]|nr:hypothetical protein [Anaerolineae bacterium]